MGDEERLNPGHESLRQSARMIGPLLVVIGGIFIVVGMVSFFSAFGSFEPPKYFWCVFVGAPVASIGIFVTKVGYLGAFVRYMAGEVAPVQKDTFNYMAKGVRPGVTDLTSAVVEGIRGTPSGNAASTFSKYCSKCGQGAVQAARFCSACGQQLES